MDVNEVCAKKAVEYGKYYLFISVALRYIDGNAALQDIEMGVAILTARADSCSMVLERSKIGRKAGAGSINTAGAGLQDAID